MRTLIFPSNSFRNVYSAVYYLAECWSALGHPVSFLVRILQRDLEYYRRLPFPTTCSVYHPEHSWLRRKWDALMFRRVILRQLWSHDCWVLVDSRFLPIAARMKRLRPGVPLIHYCLELHLPEEYPELRDARWASRYARVPDLVIETNADRARVRKARCGLREDPWILLNTVPRTTIDRIAPHPEIGRFLHSAEKPRTPIVLYAGGIGREKPFHRLVDALAEVRQNFFFLALCAAPENEVEPLRQYAAARLSGKPFAIHSSVERDEAIAIMKHCDVGLIDYSDKVENTSNQRYASPTKLFEYMGCGLAVASSYNVSIARVIDEAGCGLYGTTGEVSDLTWAVESLFANRDTLARCKQQARLAFEGRYSYEAACVPIVRQIHERVTSMTRGRRG